MSFQDRFWIACQQIVLGVNLLNPHLSLYTMAGCRKRDYPQNIFYQQPWWPLNHVVDDPLSRLCVAMAQGKYRAEALVIHPQESTFALWQSKADLSGDEATEIGRDWTPVFDDARARIGELDTDLDELTDALLGAQRTWDFGDETIISDDGKVITRDGKALFCIGEMEYPAVILPSLYTIAPSTLDLLEEFAQAGGLVLRSGRAPQWLDGEPSQRLTDWLAQVPIFSAQEALARLGAGAVEALDLPAADARLLWVHLRELEGGERLVMLCNLNRTRDFSARILLRGDWENVHQLDLRDGTERVAPAHRAAQGLIVELPFAPAQTHLLRLKPGAQFLNGSTNSPHQIGAALQTLELENWSVERLDDNAIALDYAAWKTEGDWSAQAAPVIALQNHLNTNGYKGPLSLRYEVKVEQLALARRVRLVVEHPESYQIRVNGQTVEYDGLPFWRDIRWLPIDITGLLRAGQNHIETQCATLFHAERACHSERRATQSRAVEESMTG